MSEPLIVKLSSETITTKTKLTAAVVTVTSGREALEKCIQSIDAQTYPVTMHYIVTDAIVNFYEYQDLRNHYCSDKRSVSFWDGRIGGLGLEGRRLFAAAPALVNEDVLFMLPDDDWFKPNHVESLMRLIDAGNDWAYSLMSVYDQSGEFLFDDICECLGELHPSWNTGKGFAPTGSIAMKTSLYANLSNCYNYRGFGPDRVFYDTAKQFYPKFASSGLHTNCFRLGGNETSSSRQFFEHGNRVMMERYNGKMPWRK
jgi:hypothetical protein